jgi:hypothetical protein
MYFFFMVCAKRHRRQGDNHDDSKVTRELGDAITLAWLAIIITMPTNYISRCNAWACLLVVVK